MGDVHADAISAAVEPEAEDVEVLGADLGVVPVEVGLGGVEQVQVPLAVGQPAPRRAAEHRLPVRGWLRPVGAGAGVDLIPRAGRVAGG